MAFISALATAVAGYIGVTSTLGVLLVRTAVTALVSYALNRSISKSQAQTGIDPGSRQMLSPATNHKIPVVYGSAHLGGAIIDGKLVNDNKTMFLALAISESTGKLFSTGSAPVYSLNNCYRNSDKVFLQADGVTVAYTQDADGNTDSSMAGLIKIYMYAGSGSSTKQITPDAAMCVSAPTITPVNAWDVFSGWTSTNNMTDLVFAIVRVDYNRDKNVTSIGDYQFKITNSMTLGGDCLFDYATNTRYGAGIRLSEINTGEANSTTITRMGLNSYQWIDLT